MYEIGTMLSRPNDPVKENFIFIGWSFNGIGWDFSMPVEGDMTLTAQYVPEEFTVTVNVPPSEGGSFEYRLNGTGPYVPVTGPIMVGGGTYIEIRAIVNDGYSFAWDDSRAAGGVMAFTVTGDEDLTGTFSLSSNGGSFSSWPIMMALIFTAFMFGSLYLWGRKAE
jgi:hypothetical protein